MSNRFLLIFGAIIVAFFGLLFFTKNNADAPSDNSTAEPTMHVRGPESAPVTLVEYGDFECSACANFYPLLKQVKEKYGDDLQFQFRHFPLIAIHPNAMAAHRAAEAAAKQGKFFEMHDKLYDNYSAWIAQATNNPSPLFERFASEIGLDIEQFKQDVNDSSTGDTIQADMREGQALGVTSTPTFVLNGRKIDENPTTLEAFSELIDTALQESQN